MDDNLLALCFDCHRKQHDKGWDYMATNFPVLERELNKKGWEIREEFGLKKLRRK